MPTVPLSPAESLRYDRTTALLHWATAILVVALWLSAQVIDWFPRGPARVNMRSVHMAMGIVLAALLVYRVSWRRLAGAHLPHSSALLDRAARAVHWLLYGLLIVDVLLGMTNAWVRGESFFNLFTLTSFAPDDRALRRTINEAHDLVGTAILVIAGAHAAMALVHHYFLKDDVLRRMLVSRRERSAR